jgi:hypothetical protein
MEDGDGNNEIIGTVRCIESGNTEVFNGFTKLETIIQTEIKGNKLKKDCE